MKYVKHNSRLLSLLALLLVVTIGSLSLAAAVRPSRGSSISSWSEFIAASPFSQNYVIDKPRLWLPVSGGSQVIVASLVGHGGGTPAVAEINTSEIGALTLDASNESVAWFFMVPPDLDASKDIEVTVLHSNSEAAATGTIKYTCVYTVYTQGTTAMAVPGTAFDTVGVTAVDLAANVLQWSSVQVIDGGTISPVAGEDLFGLSCKVTLATCADSSVYGARLTYHRKFLGGGGSY